MRTSPFLLPAALISAIGLAGCGDATSTPPVGDLGCAGCHGDQARAGTALAQAAPPRDAHGLTARTEVTVGAHQAHLTRGVACATCHAVPALGDRTHIDGAHAAVTFSGNVVGAQGATVAPWNRDLPTCANYCHGDFTNGNKAVVTWTSTTSMTCNSCHGATPGATASLPGGTHPQTNPDCSVCHTGYTTSTVNTTTHLNGQFDLGVLSCTSCHGDSTRAGTALEQAAPPLDSHGHAGTNEMTVGAHQAHLANGVDCTTCHAVPPAGDRTHSLEPYATVAFTGNLVGANGTPVSTWNRDVGTCTNYCHGASMPAASVPAPLWTRSTPLTCSACHADQQTKALATGLHWLHLWFVTPRPVCADCHGAGYSDTSVIAPATATHRDGQVTKLSLVGWQDPRCVADGPRACFASCHTVAPACKIWP